MITGLRVWDRDGREISNITGRYPKFIGNKTVTTAEKQTVNYTIPQGTTRIVVPVYMARNDAINRPSYVEEDGENEDRDNYVYTYDIWQVKIVMTDAGFAYDTTGQDNKQQPPIKLYWGYI
ncbi:hypothetical protein AAX05_04150 [Moraxella bovoculi]|uniref:Uncharacterized protein n=1 Tax=Moraxella bovoculi TaxID=386891 RepID=A0AAC8T850_9GAMM|nr:hypothetical protein [Moraxella bovoculi]AKG07972.1 hypothetical protein AAX06_07155 [Moraxella bovoculi]AKG08384.1 hypothetical protein AAX06_09795 [Moraxella bovoculi]AKG09492.1 hypothetical protein AAX05_04150 [Moraxella bovoculi]AKG11307.1 hypothetical protein AAX07_04125 [Moraxella bovoculi]AKG13315.1 hypothetical protein AAX11_03895 [Moraxella bovoculi]